MTTKAPSSVKSAPDSSLEKIAYASVASIPTADPHDQDRLGYNVWLWLTKRIDPLEVLVHNSASRLLITEAEAVKKIKENLRSHGLEV